MTVNDLSGNPARIRLLESEVRELAFLHETSQLLTATLDLDSVLRSLMTQVRDYFQVEAVSVALIDEEQDNLTFRVAVGKASDAVTGLTVPLGSGIAGWVTREGKSILVSDAYRDDRFYSGIDQKTGFRTHTVLAVPINTGDRTIGAMEAINPIAEALDEQALKVLGRVADQAALAIRNAELYKRARRAERRYERLFHGSPVPVLVMDFNTEILDVNQKAVELLGRAADELIGSHWRDLLGDEEAAGQTHLRDLLEASEMSTEIRIPTPRGPRTLSVNTTTIEYGGQRAIQWIGHDITERAELERMRDDLMHMIVHDLQSPLSNISGSLQVMLQALTDGDMTPAVLDILRVAMRSSKRLRRLIDSLLDLRRLEEGKAELNRVPVPPKLLAQEALELVQPIAERKEQTLHIDIPTGLPAASVDRDMITRVLTNLLDNAAKFTSSRGELALAISKEGPDLLFTVSDNGPGIPLDAQSHVFERFTRLDGARGTSGTGLGLPFCKLAVEAHGGEIWVNSAPGRGSEFAFSLPLEEQ